MLKMALKKKFQNNKVHIMELQKAVQQILFNYRTAPHSVLGVSPAKRMFNRKLRTRLAISSKTNRSKADNGNKKFVRRVNCK